MRATARDAVARLLHASTLTLTERAMADRPTDGGSFPADRYKNPETALGGADAVEKTTYVTGRGTEPEARAAKDSAVAHGSSGARLSTASIIIIALLVAAVLVYLLGFGR
jgi:hypothetical protein